MINKNPRRAGNPVSWQVAGGAVMLLLGSGITYRIAAAYYTRPSESIPIDRGTLAQLPMNIAGWKGRDVALPERVIQATDTDDHVSRTYRRQNGNETISLFLAYGVRLRDLVPHCPEVCYPSAGWTQGRMVSVVLKDSKGSALPCQIQEFSRGALQSQQIVVLNYYLVDGEYCPDVSLLRSKSWRGGNSLRYAAQIQITCSRQWVTDRNEQAEQSVCAFAGDSAPVIRELIDQATSKVQFTTKSQAG